jgi:hypothetical protein
MMHMDKVASNLAIGVGKVEATDETTHAIIRKTSAACFWIAFIGIDENLTYGAFMEWRRVDDFFWERHSCGRACDEVPRASLRAYNSITHPFFEILEGFAYYMLPFRAIMTTAAVGGAEKRVVTEPRVLRLHSAVDGTQRVLATWHEGKAGMHECSIKLFKLWLSHLYTPDTRE